MGGKPCSGIEPHIADRVEAAMPAEGFTPGPRECHDAQPGLRRADFVYPEARPRRLALEVTSIVHPAQVAGTNEWMKARERLTQVAEDEELGAWVVSVSPEARVDTLEPVILDHVRSGRTIPRHYTHHDLLALPDDAARRGFMQSFDDLKAAGLKELHPWPPSGHREHFVEVLPGATAMSTGYTDQLQACVDSKAATIAEAVAKGYEAHLAVWVGRFDRTEYRETAVPAFPPGLAVLWVAQEWGLEDGGRPLLVARPADSEWRVHRSPA